MILGLVLAAYIGVPQAGFVWDDHGLLQHNGALDAPTFEKVWLRDLWGATGQPATGYYRPLLTCTFLLDRLAFGTDAAGPHVQSLLWHLGVVWLVWALLRERLGVDRAAAAALLFGLHPLQSEAVVWISARNDLMAAAGVLATLLALDRRRHAVATLTTLAACLSKENAILVPLVAGLWRFAWGERLTRRDLVALGLGVGTALALRSQATLGGLRVDQGDLGVNVWSGLRGAAIMLGWVVWPWPLTSTASVYIPTLRPEVCIAALTTIAITVALLVRGGRRAFGLLALAAVVLAPSALGVRWYGTLGERYLYLPLFGFITAVVATVRPWRGWPALLCVGTVAALGALHVRVPDWADEESLFTAAVRRAPDGYSWNLLAIELLRQKRWPEAAAALDTAIEHVPLQRRACRHIVEAADRVLDDEAFFARAQEWSARGCTGAQAYDGALAMALATRGNWDAAGAIVNGPHTADLLHRDTVVTAALLDRAGDLTALSASALAWPSGPADLLDQVAALTQNRRGSSTVTDTTPASP